MEAVTKFHLPKDEQRRLYLYLALAQYGYLRKPNYDEKKLLKLLNSDVRKMLLEVQQLTQEQPNNHNLNKIRQFFDNHHKHLKDIVREME